MLAANVHVDASSPNFLIQEFFVRDIQLFQDILKDPSFPMAKGGFIELPTTPGLGVDLDEKALTRKPFAWRPALVLRHMWKTSPLLQKQAH